LFAIPRAERAEPEVEPVDRSIGGEVDAPAAKGQLSTHHSHRAIGANVHAIRCRGILPGATRVESDASASL